MKSSKQKVILGGFGTVTVRVTTDLNCLPYVVDFTIQESSSRARHRFNLTAGEAERVGHALVVAGGKGHKR